MRTLVHNDPGKANCMQTLQYIVTNNKKIMAYRACYYYNYYYLFGHNFVKLELRGFDGAKHLYCAKKPYK